MTTEAAGLGATLRAWRNRLSPAAAGLPARHARRAAGLRREELAELAGLSVDYVVRLEQGRATTPSAQVAAALARALQLTVTERDHLFRLARLAPPPDDLISDHIPPGVQRVAARLGDAATAIFAADWRLIWWNRSWAALLGDPSAAPPARRNFARDLFPTASDPAPVLSRWLVVSRDDGATRAAVVADLRRATGRFPRDPRLARLIRDLTDGSPEFAALWAAGAVGAHREDRKTIQHPAVGPITVDCDVLSGGDTDLRIVIMTAAPDSADETKLRLATVAGALP
ncbi:helix-turn-helix domain-containing protein [Actinoplanes awajinensis]|uniref:XRE family transcriptional regulator n=1 Tax=Actinoplanes awajinensis subsp. mycoplanecinus TaxID=135947 RepID=A0A117MN05_9ACTN|nr:helix-turn-helix domain-containing protein [Actinoplanes awajinensis]KUL26290.1 XRE family transcriptional regulator [Actinoplanes awajinensis subsp. mycoplanecinus]